ncbi:hypothetical protein KCP76_03345 [Salmonella enterica subsp. enterica serovar Weltevreden]|nr:hypothetical protein KCP76_03345 [Salmonella enterica subsp. enterica serovar Weltevreden]
MKLPGGWILKESRSRACVGCRGYDGGTSARGDVRLFPKRWNIVKFQPARADGYRPDFLAWDAVKIPHRSGFTPLRVHSACVLTSTRLSAGTKPCLTLVYRALPASAYSSVLGFAGIGACFDLLQQAEF